MKIKTTLSTEQFSFIQTKYQPIVQDISQGDGGAFLVFQDMMEEHNLRSFVSLPEIESPHIGKMGSKTKRIRESKIKKSMESIIDLVNLIFDLAEMRKPAHENFKKQPIADGFYRFLNSPEGVCWGPKRLDMGVLEKGGGMKPLFVRFNARFSYGWVDESMDRFNIRLTDSSGTLIGDRLYRLPYKGRLISTFKEPRTIGDIVVKDGITTKLTATQEDLAFIQSCYYKSVNDSNKTIEPFTKVLSAIGADYVKFVYLPKGD